MSARLTESDVRALEPLLFAVALRAVGNQTTAKDVVQDALLAAVKGLENFDGRSDLRTWVVGILSHKAVDHLRRKRDWVPIDEESEDPRLLECASRTPEAQLSDRQALKVLERALAELPDRERLAVVLCDVEGLERNEVCNVLAIGATHLRVLLHRARHRLRKAVEDAGV
jgi:RNA polymerase sigma-70 factor (ECF subfamily)